MRLGQKQEIFARNYALLILWVYKKGQALRLKELHRPKVTAEYYASIGKGIKNSLHGLGLAADIVLSIDGKVTFKVDDYEKLGTHWKSLHPDNRWGGDFRGKVKRDAGHISMTHGGIQ